MTRSKTPFGFYYIDRDYLKALKRDGNDNSPDCNYEDDGRSRKFYCGPVTTKDRVDYYVPVSHVSDKNMFFRDDDAFKTKVQYGTPILDSSGKMCGNLDYRFMVSCVDDELLMPFTPNSSYAVSNFNFCMQHKSDICKTANNAYDNIVSKEYPFLNKTAVDYDKSLDNAWSFIDEKETRIEAQQEAIKRANDRLLKAQATSNISQVSSEEELTK